MPQLVNINLRIPSLTFGPNKERIQNDAVRFIREMEVDTIPKPGEVLDITIGLDVTFQCNVIQSAWDDRADRFIVACRYAKQSIPAAHYSALVAAPEWEMRPLL